MLHMTGLVATLVMSISLVITYECVTQLSTQRGLFKLQINLTIFLKIAILLDTKYLPVEKLAEIECNH